MDEMTAKAEAQTSEAQNAVTNAEEARQRAHAAMTAKIVNDTLAAFFSAQTDKERFVSTQRIPFICSDIKEIREQLTDMVQLQRENQEKLDEKYVSQDQFWPVKTLVYGVVALMLTSVVGALLILVVN